MKTLRFLPILLLLVPLVLADTGQEAYSGTSNQHWYDAGDVDKTGNETRASFNCANLSNGMSADGTIVDNSTFNSGNGTVVGGSCEGGYNYTSGGTASFGTNYAFLSSATPTEFGFGLFSDGTSSSVRLSLMESSALAINPHSQTFWTITMSEGGTTCTTTAINGTGSTIASATLTYAKTGGTTGQCLADVKITMNWTSHQYSIYYWDVLKTTLFFNAPANSSLSASGFYVQWNDQATSRACSIAYDAPFAYACGGSDIGIDNIYAVGVEVELIEPEDGTSGSEFDSGLQDFAAGIGFRSEESQLLFTLILIGISEIIMAFLTGFFGEGKWKIWVIHSVASAVGVIFTLIGYLEWWILAVGIVLGTTIMNGGREAANTFKSLATVRRPAPTVQPTERTDGVPGAAQEAPKPQLEGQESAGEDSDSESSKDEEKKQDEEPPELVESEPESQTNEGSD